MKLFISYSRADHSIASLTYKALKEEGYEVFFDQESIREGTDFPAEIEDAIATSDGLIILLTQTSLQSEWVLKELELAEQYWKNLVGRVLPVYDKHTAIPEGIIPESIRSIQRLECDSDLPNDVLNAVRKQWPFLKIHNYESPLPKSDNRETTKLANPYLKLIHYSPENEKIFFGRESFVTDIIKRITEEKKILTVITGPSGSGKSSVVLAGITPKLNAAETKQWLFTYFRPGIQPFDELAKALSPFTDYSNSPADLADHLKKTPDSLAEILKGIRKKIDQKLMVVIDQFDELLSSPIEQKIRKVLIEQLITGIKSTEEFKKIFWIVTLQRSHLENTIYLDYPNVHTYFENNGTPLIPMNDAELRKTITGPPGEYHGIKVDEELVLKLIEEVKKKSTDSSMALLELTLWKIWDRWIETKKQDEKEITISAYTNLKGIKNIITDHANDVLENLNEYEKEDAEKIFSALLLKNDNTGLTPRISTYSSLRNFESTVNKLASTDYRLIVINDSNKTVEVVHEALIRQWNWIRDVLKKHKEFVESKERLETAAKNWSEADKNKKSYLPNKADLEQLSRLKCQNYPLSETAIDFIEASEMKEKSIARIKLITSSVGFILFLSIGFFAKFYLESNEKDAAKERISDGDKAFIRTHYFKRSGVQYVNNTNFQQASDAFEKSYKLIDDPEALIYWHNTNIKLRGRDTKYFEIIVSAPMEKNPIIAQEILRGVAQAQHEFNPNWEECKKEPVTAHNPEVCSKPALFINIANDDNEPEKAKKIVNFVINHKPNILAVIGHNASNVSNALIEIYQKNKMLMISPTSFALDDEKIKGNRNDGRNFIYTLAFDVNDLITKLLEKIPVENEKRILLCYDSSAHDQKRFKDLSRNSQQESSFSDIECNFHEPEPIPGILTDENIKANRISSLILAPHVNTLDDAINMAKENASKKKELKLKLYGSPTLYNQHTLLLGGEAVESMILPVYWHASSHNNDENKKFIKKANELWKSMNGVTWRTALAYDATQLVINGINQLGVSVNRDKLQQIISNPNNKILGVTGEIEFDKEDGIRLNSSAYLVQIQKVKNTYEFVPLK